MPWCGPIAVSFHLKEKTHQKEQHPPVTMGSPYLSAQESLASHHVHLCPGVRRSLLSWPKCVNFMLAVKPWWVRVGAILPVL